ncbi:nuclear transport factor 2 family protein [Cellvibrio sp. NN19]|uniref:nuclear transport factor 2 family protein n=1 Tax=Cellvibrio chitinivorans TaxID=3102792 RepID=UPI002B416F81|nr:nuclear transport factor 2 family protein [Cellvibrio sp. NN19]
MKNLMLVAILSLAIFGCASQQEKCASSSPQSSDDAAVVDGHLAAYNKHDLEGMLKFFHPEIEAYSSSGELQRKGLESFRAAFSETFKSSPNEVVVARIIQGNRIIDQVDTSFQNGAHVVTERDTIIYTIEQGLIRKIKFL